MLPHHITILLIGLIATGCRDSKPATVGDDVGRPPTVEITAPMNGEMVEPDAPIALAVSVGDDTTPPQDVGITIESDLDGEIPHTDTPNEAGDFKTEISLSSGSHTLRVTATDQDGQKGTDEISLVANGRPSAPVIAIVPEEPELTDDLLVEIIVEAVDPDGDPINYEIGWTVLNPDMETASVYNPSEPSKIPSAATERGAIWEVTVTPKDAFGDGDAATTDVMVANGAPSIESVTISPEDPRTADTLTAVVTGFTDPDDDPEQYLYEWTKNGSVVADEDGSEFPFTEHSRDDIITVTVTPIDDFSEGDAIESDPVTILNTAPSSSTVEIDPGSPQTSDELTVITLGWSDADGDAENYTYRWFADGLEDTTTTSATYPSSRTARGGVYQVEITPYDGIDTGTPLLSAEVSVGNTAPEILGTVTLAPSAPTTNDEIKATPSGWSDADGDPESYLYEWTVNGTVVSERTDTLRGYFFERGDIVQVTVTPFDGIETGTPAIGGPVTIRNSTPSVGSVTITPNPARTGDSLSCSWSGFSDADGDGDESTAEWFINGTSAGTDLTLAGGFSGGDTVTCQVTPHDGLDAGSPNSATLVIDNTAPAVETVTITPDPAYATDTLTCSWTGFSDADGDPDASTARWTVNGTRVADGTTLTGSFVGTDTVTCIVLPSDGTSTGTEVSTSIVIGNSVPTIDSVSISSTDTPALTGSTLTCNWSGFSDADDESDVSTVVWNNSSGAVLGTDTTLAGAFTGGDTITCTVTPFDGTETGTPLTSDPITIDNSPPVLELAALTPVPAYTDDTLTCAPGVTTDPDGDTAFTYTYRWQVAGVLISTETSSTLDSSHFFRGQTVLCEITPYDGADAGDPVNSNIVTIQNSRPVVDSIILTPTTVATNDVINLTLDVSDADEEAIFTLIEWKVDGIVVLSGYTATVLSGTTYFDKDQVITVDVTPEDGAESGETATGGPIVVINTPPYAPDVEIDPSAPEPGEDLYCEVITESSDEDGDAVTYSTQWYRDGSATTHTSDVLAGSFTTHGEHWECEVTPFDGDDSGDVATDSVVINDMTDPDPPVFDDENIYTNDTTRTVTGDCEADCAVEVTCIDDLGSTVDTTTCSSSGSFSIDLDVVRGDLTTCTATCTDIAGNTSGPSDEIVIESCDPEDVYEDTSGSGDSPGDPVGGFSSISDDGLDTITITGNIVDGDVDDWYVISASDDVAADLAAGVDYFNFHVQMTDGTSDYRMEIHKGGSGAGDLECSSGVGYTEYNWFPQDVGDGVHSIPSDTRACAGAGSETRNICEDNSDEFYIHVYRLSIGPESCQSYELTIDNGVW